jgi:hypothetical protein
MQHCGAIGSLFRGGGSADKRVEVSQDPNGPKCYVSRKLLPGTLSDFAKVPENLAINND